MTNFHVELVIRNICSIIYFLCMMLWLNHFMIFKNLNTYIWPNMKVLLHLLDKLKKRNNKKAWHVALNCHMEESLHTVCIIEVLYAGMWICVYV